MVDYSESQLNRSLKNYIKYGDLEYKMQMDEALDWFVNDAPAGTWVDLDLFIEDLRKLADKRISEIRLEKKPRLYSLESNTFSMEMLDILKSLIEKGPKQEYNVSYRNYVYNKENSDAIIVSIMDSLNRFGTPWAKDRLSRFAKLLLLDGVQSPKLTTLVEITKNESYRREQRLQSILNVERLFDGAYGTEYGLKTIYSLLQTTDFPIMEETIHILDEMSTVNIKNELAASVLSIMFSIANLIADKNIRNIERLDNILIQLEQQYRSVIEKDQKYLQAKDRQEFIAKHKALQESVVLQHIQLPIYGK